MIVAGVELDVNPLTLQEWSKINKDFEQGLERLMTVPKDFSYQIPVCFRKDPENPRVGIPVPEELGVMLSCLDRVRFTENINATEGVGVVRGNGIDIKTIQTLHNTFDKIEEAMGLLPELPKSVDGKAKDNRQRLEWRRKRRVQAREKKKQKKLLDDKKALDNKVEKQTKKLVKGAKESKMTLKEAQAKNTELEEKISQLKADSKASRFEASPDIDKENILFEPTPKQAEFLAAPEKVVFYGGAAGGIC